MLPVTYCQNLKTLFVPKFSISNFHIGVRARGVAAGQILPARRRSVAACIPDGGARKCVRRVKKKTGFFS